MTFIDQARLDNADILHAIFYCDFTQGIVKGSLPKKSFDFYITQEIYFLNDYIRAAGACAAKAEDEDIPFFITIQDLIYKEMENASAYYANADNFNFTSALTPAYLNYSAFIMRCAYQASLEIAFSALYAAPVAYFLISDKFLGSLSPDHPYYPWLAVNNDPNIILLVEEYRRFINLCAVKNPALASPMGEAVRTSLFYFYYFLEDCFHKRDFYSLSSEPPEL